MRDDIDPTDPLDHDELIGQIIDSRYRVLERIGHGGMGSVYKVVHTQMGKIAAMKLLHSSMAGDPELIKRFHREAEAISRLSHPNIVQVFDFGRVAESVFIVMEYLKGEDLGHLLQREGPLPAARCIPILVQICDALTEAHALRIIHRDLKPENVRIAQTRDGQDFVKVLDFGLAKVLEDEKELSITAKGNLVGTPYYMAPELIRGELPDQRCDLYSLGAVAYRMLTGVNAYVAKTPVGVLTKHITDPLTLPSARAPTLKIPPQLDAVVAQAMAKEPRQRYQDAQQLKRDLLGTAEQLALPYASPAGSFPQITISPLPAAPEAEVRAAATPAAPVAQSGETIMVSPVLAKEDLAFERRLRRGRLYRLLLLPALGALVFAIYWYGVRPGEIYAPTREIEPNNTPDQATPLFNSRPLSAQLGKRISAIESDRDWYRLQVQGTGPQTVSARVTGIPNMDLTLELYDAMAGRITGADSAGKGGGEVITNWTVDPGSYYLMVREVWVDGVAPTENVTDSYQIEARWHPYVGGWEMEPNDRPDQAVELAAGDKLRGHLGGIKDRDCIKVTSAAGLLGGVLSGIPGADLVLEVTPSGAATPIVIDEGGPGAGERFSGIAADGKEPVRLTIYRRDTEKPPPGQEPRGLQEPYALEVWLR